MARFSGEVGFGKSVVSPPDSGVWVDEITEMLYQGDVVRNVFRQDNTGDINEDIVAGNAISIVADQYAFDNFFDIKYVRWAGVLWTVTSVEVRSPRLILNLGSVYNGPEE